MSPLINRNPLLSSAARQILSRILIVSLVLTVGACSSEELIEQLSPQARFDLAMKYFQEGDYVEAEKEFRVVVLQFQGTALADDAQFYLGECQYMREQFILAAYEYEVLLRTMPTSEYVPRARFRRAMCYYNQSRESYRDQTETKKAIDEFQAFLEYHPTDTLAHEAAAKIQELNTKLAKKEFDNGVLYMKMESYRAAIIYFDLVLERFHDTPYAEEAQLKKAEAFLLRKRPSEALAEIDRYLQRYPNGNHRGEAQKLRETILTQLSTQRDSSSVNRLVAPNSVKQF
ncbi:MAG TPA: outer membrane protein assembly factor BamD [Bacteroidota bacterium]|nr:outer membrane protein assembly factor BamD [Bacteroidota bacterium]